MPSKVPRVVLPEDIFVNIATAAGAEVNQVLRFLQDVACGGSVKQFLIVCLHSCPFLLFKYHLSSRIALKKYLLY